MKRIDTLTILKKHFKDDEKNFLEIKSNLEKHSQISIQNGEHLSFFNKNLVELKNEVKELRSGYTNRELDTFFGEMRETLKRIEEQTLKTNGSVINLKSKVNDLDKWKYGNAVAVAIITGIIIPLIGYIFYTQVEHLKERMEYIRVERSIP